MILVDTNVLLDVVTDDEDWASWSIARLDAASVAGPILINHVIYSELAIRFDSIEVLDAVLRNAGVTVGSLPRSALFLAGQVFRRRDADGAGGIPPDCFVGAHAAVERMPLLTREPERYRKDFPTVHLIAPSPSTAAHHALS